MAILSPSQYYHCEHLEYGMTGSFSNGRKDAPDPYVYPFVPGDVYSVGGVPRRKVLYAMGDDVYYHDLVMDEVRSSRVTTFMHWAKNKNATKG